MPAWRDFSVRNVNAPEKPSTRRTASFALGYEDCNDATTLRRDPALKVCCDRDPFSLFTAAFRAVLRAAGIECLKLPPQSPNLNSVAEPFVLSIKRECLDKIVPLGERHLRLAISEFIEHYHRERNHQGLDNRLITAPANDNDDPARPIARRERLGGLLSYCYRAVA